jgi:hypothetical protein
MLQQVGRKRGPVWMYFEEKNVDGVDRVMCTICNWTTTLGQQTAMRLHLKSHGTEFQQFLKQYTKEKLSAEQSSSKKATEKYQTRIQKKVQYTSVTVLFGCFFLEI